MSCDNVTQDECEQYQAYIHSLGLVINTQLHCFCCEFCEVALTPSQVQGHISRVHAGSKICVDHQLLQASAEALDVLPDFPSPPGELTPPFDHIKVQEGLRCSHCPKVLGQPESMKKHHNLLHHDHPVPAKWSSCFMQRLSTQPGYASSFFEVMAPIPQLTTSIDVMIQKLNDDMENARKLDVTAQCSRRISPWLLTTGWHEHVAGHDTQELLDLISFPREAEFPQLKQTVLAYMEQATALINSTAELPLQRLNTPDPTKE
jgi:hypothetical protein